ncbi:hypothetical protein [Halobacillus hunanensis]
MRKEKVERSFADSKELHGLRYCRLQKNRGSPQAVKAPLVGAFIVVNNNK